MLEHSQTMNQDACRKYDKEQNQYRQRVSTLNLPIRNLWTARPTKINIIAKVDGGGLGAISLINTMINSIKNIPPPNSIDITCKTHKTDLVLPSSNRPLL